MFVSITKSFFVQERVYNGAGTVSFLDRSQLGVSLVNDCVFLRSKWV